MGTYGMDQSGSCDYYYFLPEKGSKVSVGVAAGVECAAGAGIFNVSSRRDGHAQAEDVQDQRNRGADKRCGTPPGIQRQKPRAGAGKPGFEGFFGSGIF